MLSALEPDAPRGESTAMALSRPSSPPAPLAATARAVAPDAPIDVDGEAAHLKHGLRAVAALDDAVRRVQRRTRLRAARRPAALF